jgi:hypothetical protein
MALAEAHYEWDKLLSMDEFRLVMKLQPGDTMVVANHVSSNVIWLEQCVRWCSLFTL